MPIKIPNTLPAAKTLASENIFVMTETRALTQDIRPLRILILNLMPTKVETETQLARLLETRFAGRDRAYAHREPYVQKHLRRAFVQLYKDLR